MRQTLALRGGQLDGQFYSEQAEQRSELDDGIQGHRRSVLEWIANGVSHDGGVVKRSAFLLQLHFHDLFGVIPCAPGISHKDRLVQAEYRDREQVADEK